MIRLTSLSAYYWVVAQSSGGGGSSGFPVDLGVFGVAGTTIAILLYIARILWNDNKELRSENNTIQQVAIERVADIAAKSSAQLADGGKTLEAATIMMHQLSGRPGLDPEQLAELNYHLRALREINQRAPEPRERRTD